jgi:hypothetical protein
MIEHLHAIDAGVKFTNEAAKLLVGLKKIFPLIVISYRRL